MDLGPIKLGWCTWEGRTGFTLVVALTVTMEEGDVADTGPTVLNNSVRNVFGHGVFGISVTTQN